MIPAFGSGIKQETGGFSAFTTPDQLPVVSAAPPVTQVFAFGNTQPTHEPTNQPTGPTP